MIDIIEIQENYKSLIMHMIDKAENRLSIVATGAGMALADLPKYCGASKIVDQVLVPYSFEAISDLIGTNTDKAVSRERLEDLHSLHTNKGTQITVTGALSSDRYRRGDNHAYVRINDLIYHIHLVKESEESHNAMVSTGSLNDYRQIQDILISSALLILADSPDHLPLLNTQDLTIKLL